MATRPVLAELRALARVRRAVMSTVGVVVGRRALVFGSGLALAASVLFAPQGLQARDVVRWFHAAAATRAALGALWVLLATPVVAGAFDAPGTRTLRATPVPRRVWIAWVGALVLALQLPVGALFARAGEPATGLSAMAMAAAIEAGLVGLARHARPARRAALAGLTLAAAALVVVDVPAPVSLGLALALCAMATSAAWRVALDAAAGAVRWTRRGPPFLVLAVAHALRLTRAARARLALAAGAAGLGAGALALSLRNDPPAAPIARALAVLGLPLAVAAGVLVAPLLESEARVAALARVMRTRWTTLFAAFALALATPTSALAATAAVTARAASSAGLGAPAPFVAVAGLWGAGIALAVAGWARWHARTARRDPVIFVLGVLGVAVVATGVAAW